MKKSNLKFFVVFFLLFAIFFLSACSSKDAVKITGLNSENSSLQNDSTLSILQVNACNAANDGGTCETKLEDLGIVTKKECCSKLNKCC